MTPDLCVVGGHPIVPGQAIAVPKFLMCLDCLRARGGDVWAVSHSTPCCESKASIMALSQHVIQPDARIPEGQAVWVRDGVMARYDVVGGRFILLPSGVP